jgi:excisionase family DNA binding protein
MVYSKQEAARILGIATITIDRNRRIGKLPYRKIGRRVVFTQEDIDKFLAACSVPQKRGLLLETAGECHE